MRDDPINDSKSPASIPDDDVEVPASFEERRRHARYSRNLPLSITGRAQELPDDDIELANISLKGLSFWSFAPAQPGELFDFRVEIPIRGCVSGRALARWRQKELNGPRWQCGAEIVSFRWGERSRLRSFLPAPEIPEQLDILDQVLLAAVILMSLAVAHTISQGDADLPRRFTASAQEALEWLPSLLIVGASAAAIALLLRSR